MDVREKFVTERVARCWDRLPVEAVDASSLEVFETRLDGALGSLIWWMATLPITVGFELYVL